MSKEKKVIHHVKLHMRSGSVVEFNCCGFETKRAANGEFTSISWGTTDGVSLHGINPAQIDAITYTYTEREGA